MCICGDCRTVRRRRRFSAVWARAALIALWALLCLVHAQSSRAADGSRVRITEAMIDPRAVEDGFGEWIELANAGEEPVDLNGWTLVIGDQRHVVRGELPIRPGQYVVLARNRDEAMNGGVVASYQWATLHIPNSEGELLLLSPAQEVVDRVSWGDGVGRAAPPAGASLERQGLGKQAPWGTGHARWPGSDGDLGSPGAAYTAAPPTPTAIPSSTPSPTQPPAATALPTQTPTGTPTVTPAPPTPTPVPPTATPPQTPPRILLSEVMANPAAVEDKAGEWLELLNADGEPVNLRGWLLADLDQDRHTIAADVWIQPGEYLVLGRSGDAGANGGVVVRYVYDSFALANEADEIILAAPWGAETDRLVWGGESGLNVAKGASMERTGFGTGDGWVTAAQPWPDSSGDRGSPNAPYVARPTPTPTPTLAAIWPIAEFPSALVIDEVYVDGTDHEYVVLFNTGASSVDLAGWSIGDAETPGDGEGIYALPEGVMVNAGEHFIVARNGQAFLDRWGREPDAEVKESSNSIPALTRRGQWASGSLALNDEGDEVLLLNPAMQIADAAAYGEGRYDAVGLAGALRVVKGYSLQRVPGFRFPAEKDIRYRFLTAPPRPFEVRGLPVASTIDNPPVGAGLIAVWGTMGARSNFSSEGQAPPHYVAAAAAANGLDFVAIADTDATHAVETVRSASPALLLPAWRWRNVEGAQAVVYGPQPGALQSWADLRMYLDANGYVAQAQVEAPPSIARLAAIAADAVRVDDVSPLYENWRATGRPLLPAGNSNPPADGLGAEVPRYTGLAVERADAASVLAAVAARRGWLTSAPGLWLSLRVQDGPWMGQTIFAANEITLEVRYGDRSGEPAGLALWQDDRPVRQLDVRPQGETWTVTVPAVPGSFLYAVATQLDGDFAVTAPLMVERTGGGQAVLNELLPSPWTDWNGDGATDSGDEFVELYNGSDAPLALDGWRLSDKGSENSPNRQYVFGPGRYVPARGFLLLWNEETRLSLNNDGDRIRLLNRSGAVVDEIGWAQPPGQGLSIARLPDGGAWVAGTAVTPGSANRMPDGDTQPPRPNTDDGDQGAHTEVAAKIEQGQAAGAPGSLASAKLQGLGAEVEFRAQVVAPPGLFNSSIYVAEPVSAGDGTASTAGLGMQVYLHNGVFMEMAEGDWVLVRGRLRSFRGELEAVVDRPDQVWRYAEGTPVQPLPIRAYDIGETLESRLVTFTGMVTGWQGDSIYLCDPERPEIDARVTVRSSLGWRRPYVNEGEWWQVTGVVSQFAKEHPWNGGYRVLVRYEHDLVEDARLLGVASSEGLATEDPNSHP